MTCPPPKGLPIDFYSVKWFKGLPNIQKERMIDLENIAFLPNPEDSLKSQKNSNEKLSDKKFNQKYLTDATKPYNLESLETENNGKLQNEDEDEEDDSIDLYAPSPDASGREGDYYGPGKYSYEEEGDINNQGNSEREWVGDPEDYDFNQENDFDMEVY
ncbi:hypothetical protein O181_108638 [Austropuccinia psidii MF-1]|uniref:Uncharacterized protein n=1 Tax=Austropuccinia psidii MF-1 TaxID=1389203 RepID=A0A9Q3PP15_9BASI|nr:hypothetical protein [Austropuccinia psidii MF-1]